MGRARVTHDPRSYSTRLGVRVRELREGRRMTVDELAKKLGVEPAALYRWENGLRDVPLDLLPKIGAALKVKAADLMPKF